MVKKSPNQKLFFGYARMRQRTKLNGSMLNGLSKQKNSVRLIKSD